MGSIFKKHVVSTPMDRADGALGPKKLAVLVIALLVAGAVIIFLVQAYIASTDTFEATVTGVAEQGTFVNFTLREGSGDTDIASYPTGMDIQVGDKVLVKADEDEGNVVLEVLDE